MEEKWEKIFSKNGTLMYEGYVADGKPHGAGTSFFKNGNKYQEGVFGERGLIHGCEYYQNGIKRFEGTYTVNKKVGPNYPTYGICYDEEGKEIYRGELKIRFHGKECYPTVSKPEEYGCILPKNNPVFGERMWADDEKLFAGKYYVELKGKKNRREFIGFLIKNGFSCEEDEITTKESTIASRYPIKVDFDNYKYGHLNNITAAAGAVSSHRLCDVKFILMAFECNNDFVIV